MDTNIQVSIICCAYNQENYIEDALKGFVMQKTDFNYEVLISDDASTDRTPEIIREYEKKYPDIIKPVYLTENVYSTGKYPGEILMKKAQGKYFALCEGDDYWISDHKLQRQYDALEKHPECDMSAHGALKVRPDDCSTIGTVEPMKEDGILTMEKVIDGGGDFIATNSLFFRRKLAENPPDYLKFTGIDYAYQMCGAARGGIVYLSEIMSAYRRGAQNSWTVKFMKSKREVMIGHLDKMMKMLDMANEETQHKFEKDFVFAKSKYEFQKATLQRDVKTVYGRKFASFRKQMSAKRKLILGLQCFAPWSISVYHRIKSARNK